MTSNDAEHLRIRIAELEREMIDFRIAMAKVLSSLYDTVHDMERWQRWNQTQSQEAVERLKLLRDCIADHFSLSEVQTMCFDLDVNFDDLEGEGLENKARELVLYMNRNGRCPELVFYCREHRPHIKLPWQ